MADINRPARQSGGAEVGHAEALLAQTIELMFFAYRDFTSDPDAILAERGFGRAHHRVLHFVSRYPGLRVADLLEILKITKQSLARVLKQLIEEGFIEQRSGPVDRRERLLYTTEAGSRLARKLMEPQLERVADALRAAASKGGEAVEAFLFAMIDPAERGRVLGLIGRSRADVPADEDEP